MSFGLSGAPRRSVMIGGDVISAWLDQSTGQGNAVDYYLSDKSQCQGGRGACPDTEFSVRVVSQRETNSIINFFLTSIFFCDCKNFSFS